ncbi:MAG: 3-hydroxybutyryl-CoA dehydrogenase [Chloroflexota bacterium]|jgi:3-hydroxybutyryl-CoA dehydrogenase|nr:3-hydroxybutyryl-CoA dehydrogenase [Chloroflexota bacterium]
MTVGVVGAGTMGAGIAQATLAAGHRVLLHDADPAAVARGRQRIESGLDRSIEKGKLSPEGKEEAMGRLREAAGLEEIAAGSDLVVEAALEDLALKRSIFRALDMHALPDVPLATNTSSLSVTRIAEATHHRERVLGLHFFNPAPVMPLVEVVATDGTARAALQAGIDFVAGLGKTPIVSADAPGFVVNRVNRGFTLEPLRMLEAGEATVEAIDGAVEAAGYPMGPFRLMDLVGVDIGYAVATSLYEAFDEAGRFRPSPVQAQMIEAGRLGRKTGWGFYRYDEEASSAGAADIGAIAAGGAGAPAGGSSLLSAAAIVERVNLAIVNEAYRAVEERVASPQDVDVAMKLGAGHPEGPFERAGRLGLRAVIEGLRRQAAAAALSGDQFEVAPLLWQIATA